MTGAFNNSLNVGTITAIRIRNGSADLPARRRLCMNIITINLVLALKLELSWAGFEYIYPPDSAEGNRGSLFSHDLQAKYERLWFVAAGFSS